MLFFHNEYDTAHTEKSLICGIETHLPNLVVIIASLAFGFYFLLFFAASRRRRQPNPLPTNTTCDI